MASSGVNVLRWSALGFGVIYGVYHQSSISSTEKTNAINRDYERKQRLISDAKAAYIKKTQPVDKQTASGAVSDPEDPKFDLEAFLNAAK